LAPNDCATDIGMMLAAFDSSDDIVI
jgi:hypothetical protein